MYVCPLFQHGLTLTALHCACGCVPYQMDPAARLLPHQLLAPGSWLNPHLTDPRLNRHSDPDRDANQHGAGSAPAAS